jgi:hypothetical protein
MPGLSKLRETNKNLEKQGKFYAIVEPHHIDVTSEIGYIARKFGGKRADNSRLIYLFHSDEKRQAFIKDVAGAAGYFANTFIPGED